MVGFLRTEWPCYWRINPPVRRTLVCVQGDGVLNPERLTWLSLGRGILFTTNFLLLQNYTKRGFFLTENSVGEVLKYTLVLDHPLYKSHLTPDPTNSHETFMDVFLVKHETVLTRFTSHILKVSLLKLPTPKTSVCLDPRWSRHYQWHGTLFIVPRGGTLRPSYGFQVPTYTPEVTTIPTNTGTTSIP